MTILSEVYSAHDTTDVVLHTIEISSDAWDDAICLVQDFADHTVITEDGRSVLARGSGIDISLPKKDSKGAQNITFAIDGVRGEATKLLRESLYAQQEVRLTYRTYLASDLSSPADNPYHFVVRSFTAKADSVEITAGIFDFIDMKWPRVTYNSTTTPCLKYMQ